MASQFSSLQNWQHLLCKFVIIHKCVTLKAQYVIISQKPLEKILNNHFVFPWVVINGFVINDILYSYIKANMNNGTQC